MFQRSILLRNRALLESLSSALEKERGKAVTEWENCVVSIRRGGVFLTGLCSRPSCGPSTGQSLSLNTKNMTGLRSESLPAVVLPLKRLLFIQISPITKTTWLWTDQMALKCLLEHFIEVTYICVLEVTCRHATVDIVIILHHNLLSLVGMMIAGLLAHSHA